MPNQELLNYIKKQIESGAETEKIKDSLRSVGWQDIDINEAFLSLGILKEELPQVSVLNQPSPHEPVENPYISKNQDLMEKDTRPVMKNPSFVPEKNEEREDYPEMLLQNVDLSPKLEDKPENISVEENQIINNQPNGGNNSRPDLNFTAKRKFPIKKALLTLVFILIIGGVAAAGVGYYYLQSPEKVIQDSFIKFNETKSYGYTGKIKAEIKSNGEFFSDFLGGGISLEEDVLSKTNPEKNIFLMEFDGSYDAFDPQNLKGNFNLDLNLGESDKNIFTGRVETIFIGKDSYIKLAEISDLGDFDLSFITGKWIKIGADFAKQIPNFQQNFNFNQKNGEEKSLPPDFNALSEEDKQEIIKKAMEAIKNRNMLKNIEKLPDQKMEREDSYHFSLEIDKNESKELFKEIVKVVYEKQDLVKPEDIKTFDNTIDEMAENLEISDIELWIGKKSKNLYKFSSGIIARDKNNSEEGLKILFSVNFKNFNDPVKAEVPADAVNIEDIFKDFFGLMLGMNSSLPSCDKVQDEKEKKKCLEEIEKANKMERDISRISDIKQLQLAVEMFFDDNEFYPSSLNELTPKYIEKIPLDTLDKKPYFYTPHVSDGVNTFVEKGKFDGYHIGVNLENQDKYYLDKDKDCNSITGKNCNFKSGYRKTGAFNGSDSQGCGGEKNRYCYDTAE